MGKNQKFNSAKAGQVKQKNTRRKLAKDEAEGHSHAREKHVAPLLDDAPSVDAYLKERCRRERLPKASAFLNERDQERAVAFARNDKDATRDDRVKKGSPRIVLRSEVKGELTKITVRVAEKIDKDNVE